MAEQNCTSPSSPTPVIITSTTEQVKSDGNDSSSISSSCDSRNFLEKNSSDEKTSVHSQSFQSNSKLFGAPTISSSSENGNGIAEKNEKGIQEKSTSFLRPSILSSGFSSFSSKNVESSKVESSFDLKSPKLNFTLSKFGDSSLTNPPVTQSKNAFLSSVSFGNEKNESLSSSLSSSPLPSNSLQSKISNTGNGTDDKFNKPTLGIFSNAFNSNTNTSVSSIPKTSVISVPNFVFGQNLHERVTDSVKTTNERDKSSPDIKTNGSSDMLFTSVLKSKEVKENFSSDVFGISKESSSLIEDAARCQEARANKRKYEEVLVVTGEEDEQNIIQINVKLFAFDSGAWVERGRGILRLNDKNSGGKTSSRIVIRTLGSLRVVLNTKIWSGMSLSRASERSARLTAMDPSGQVKIFLIQASLKDMTSLYPLLEDRIKLCEEKEKSSEESPPKKIALEKENM